MTSSLVLMPWPTDAGYAITTLERLFFDLAVRLAGGDASRVHFTYPDLSPGPPASLPEGFPNVWAVDVMRPTAEVLRRLEQIARDHAVDFALTFDIQPVHPMYRALRRGGVRTVVSYWGAPISGMSSPWKRLVKRALIQLSRSRADGLVFESQAMADLALHGRGVPPDMIDVVPLGVDEGRYRPAPGSTYVHDALGIPRSRRVAVFSGHCTERKGIPTLVAAAIELLAVRKRTDVCLLVCGNKGDESRPYEARYAGLGIDDGIRFAGYRRDLLGIFQSAYCGVIPSSGWDSFTMSSIEMAATGLPVVASRLQGLAEAVHHEQTGLLFEPGNPQALADALERLLDQPDLARRYGEAGRARVERELTLDRQRQRLLAAVCRHLPADLAAGVQRRRDPVNT